MFHQWWLVTFFFFKLWLFYNLFCFDNKRLIIKSRCHRLKLSLIFFFFFLLELNFDKNHWITLSLYILYAYKILRQSKINNYGFSKYELLGDITLLRVIPRVTYLNSIYIYIYIYTLWRGLPLGRPRLFLQILVSSGPYSKVSLLGCELWWHFSWVIPPLMRPAKWVQSIECGDDGCFICTLPSSTQWQTFLPFLSHVSSGLHGQTLALLGMY